MNEQKFKKMFFHDTLKVAQRLLGMKLAARLDDQITSGMIVEVEA